MIDIPVNMMAARYICSKMWYICLETRMNLWHFLYIFLDLLSKAIADAHGRTCLYTNQQIERMKLAPAPALEAQLEAYKDMVTLGRGNGSCVEELFYFIIILVHNFNPLSMGNTLLWLIQLMFKYVCICFIQICCFLKFY